VLFRSNLSLLPGGNLGGSAPSNLVNRLLERSVGLSLGVLWAIVVVVASSSLLMLYFGLSWCVEESSTTLSSLLTMGMSKRRAGSLFAVSTAGLGAAAGVGGYFVSYLFLFGLAKLSSLQLFFQPLYVQQSWLVLLISASFPVAATFLLLPIVFSKPLGDLV